MYFFKDGIMNKKSYNIFLAILNSELVVALGCTEPIAIAYAGARARQVLGAMPDKSLSAAAAISSKM
jgi:L-cysteine desulfidase